MVILAPAVDLTLTPPPVMYVEAPVLSVPLPPPAEPGPGDSGVPLPAPVPRRAGTRWDLTLADPVSHAHRTTLATADVTGWSVPAGLEVGSIDVASVSPTDPGWLQLGQARTIRGLRRHNIDPSGYEVFLGRDGVTVAAGVVVSSTDDLDAGRLRVAGPSHVLENRTLGDGGVIDQLGGRGSFPSRSLNGFEISGLAWNWTQDSFDGSWALSVKGIGYVKAPWVSYAASPNAGVQHGVHTQMMVADAAADAWAGISSEIRSPAGVVQFGKFSEINAGGADQGVSEWQQVSSIGTMPGGGGNYWVRAVVAVIANDWIRVDRITYTQRGATGSHAPQDLTWYIAKAVQSAQRAKSGGKLGVSVKVRGPVGVTDKIRWLHEDDPHLMEILSSLTDRSDGPEAWFDTAWTIQTGRRQGQDRTDIVLTDSNVLSWSRESDGDARFDSLRVSTGYGAGPSRVALGFETPTSGRSRRTTVRAPNELSYRQAEDWGVGHAKRMAAPQRTFDFEVPMALGLRLACGDGVWAACTNGGVFVDEALRIGEQRFDIKADTCTLNMSSDPKVKL